MPLIFVGGLVLLALVVMFASGTRDFALWWWLGLALIPIGAVICIFGIARAGLSVSDTGRPDRASSAQGS